MTDISPQPSAVMPQPTARAEQCLVDDSMVTSKIEDEGSKV